MWFGIILKSKVKKNFKLKKIIKKLAIAPLNSCTISFLNWFSEYNLIPKGMALKLHLLSGDAIEKYKDKDYEIYNTSFKKKNYQLTDDQEKVLEELQINNDRFIFNLRCYISQIPADKTYVHVFRIKF